MKHLGIVVAMTPEARSLAKKVVAADEVVCLAEGVVIQLCGIGAQRAERAANHLLKHGAAALLSWGIAGGLAPNVSAGSLVIPKVVVSHRRRSYPTHPAWHDRLFSRLKGCLDLYQDPLAETMTVLKTRAEKAALLKRTGAVAADMESGAVAEAARKAHVPFMAIRAVADSADTTIPPICLGAVDEFGELNLLRLVKGLTRHPFELFPMIRLGRDSRAAQAALATAARLAGNDFLVP